MSERGKSSIALSGPTAATGTARDPLVVDAERRGRLAGAALICQVQDDGGSFDMVNRGGARPGEFRQGRPGLVAQGHGFHFGFAWHAAPCSLQSTVRLADLKLAALSTRLKVRVVLDQVEGFGKRHALKQEEPFTRVPVVRQIEAIPADIL